MNEIPLSFLFGLLVILLMLSAFFSGSETGIMSLDKYKLKHQAKEGHSGALRCESMLKRPDRLIGTILLGNNFVNIFASSIATVIALRLYGEAGIAVAAILLTIVVIIFSEVAPKTAAALHPERVAFPASFILKPLGTLLSPLVILVNFVANGLLKLLKAYPTDLEQGKHLTSEELSTIVMEAGSKISSQYQQMLLKILVLEKVTVSEIMVPRHEIHGINLQDDLYTIQETLAQSSYTRLAVYEDSIDHILGVIHLREIFAISHGQPVSKEMIREHLRTAYFVPENTQLNVQLVNFRKEKQRMAFIVDEYGDLQGLTTLDDILEEIVGEFTSDIQDEQEDAFKTQDGSIITEGGAYIRELNRDYHLSLPEGEATTLNGLILEYLENIPSEGTCVNIENYPMQILKSNATSIESVKILPRILTETSDESSRY
jgi:Mg2+/Co2+ transporter CorB